MQSIIPFFMFEGKAEEAMNFYISLFPNSGITDIKRYGKNEAGPEGTVMKAKFTLNGTDYMCIDSPAKHAFGFTPSLSLFVNCDDEQAIDNLYRNLSEGGSVMMPLGAYPFAKKFCWVSDRFGVSWQLSLA